ncbi:alpha/beta hydrolase [Amycolatopsis sp. GM8]|uniref:alpha/beta hydrolase n=1 Tax=Amycolatopsis sp. GM8 TaxID=2896530 RepID=UPI001F2C7E2A|nr:alpha/beta hydrolase [Amycolatopsis sp. GM8]
MARRAVLVHGAWHGSWTWQPVLSLLRERDVDPVTVDLPSAGKGGDLQDDVEVVRRAVLADDRDTVLVAHSYGGMVITEAALELPTVRHLVYVCAFMLDAGDSVVGAADGALPDWQDVDSEQGVIRVTSPMSAFYGDLPADLAAEYSGRLTTQSVASFAQPLSGAAWRTIDSTYLVCEQDQAIPAPAQRMMAERATHRIEIASSHTPMASRPQVVADLITGVTVP